MSFDEDPEVLADLRLRESSAYDRERARPVDISKLWSPPVFVAEWRCRFPGPKSPAPPCRVMIPVSSDDVERLQIHNDELSRRGEQPIETHEVMLCDAHRKLAAEYRAKRLPELHTKLRDAIQKLKQSNSPRIEKELIETLHKLHHPDVEGLLQALEEKLGSKRKGRAL